MDNCSKMISFLLHSRTQTHVFHWQTKSYAEHKALGDYYGDIVDLLDDLVESYQGKYGILSGYETFPIVDYTDSAQIIEFFEKLVTAVEVLRQGNDDSYLQNQIDNVVQLIQTTNYKLRFLS